MPELKRQGQSGKMNTDFHERILPPGEYREALNINIGRSETSEVGTVENLKGNHLINFDGGDSDNNRIATNATCIGSIRDNANERIYYFITSNDSFDESNSGEHGIYMFDQRSNSLRILVDNTDSVTNKSLNFHKNYPITGLNILENLLFWTDNRNQPRKINIDRAIDNSGYYSSDVLMAVAKLAPYEPPTISSAFTDPSISSTFLEDKLPRFSYRWQFEDGEYSVLAPFTQPVFRRSTDDFTAANRTELASTGALAGFINDYNSITLTIPVPSNAGVTSVELIYKDVSQNTVYIIEDQQVTTATTVSFTYKSQDPYRALPESQITRVSDAVPRKALAQEVAGSRIVYGNFLTNFNLPEVDFTVGIQDRPVSQPFGTLGYSVKTRRTYQVGIVLADQFGRQTPVILSSSGNDTIFSSYDDIRLGGRELTITFNNVSQLEGFHSYRVVIKQSQQEYYNFFPGSSGARNGDNVNKLPIDLTEGVSMGSDIRPSSRRVYGTGNSLQPVTINNTSGNILIAGSAPTSSFYEVEPVESLLNIFYETSTSALVSSAATGTAYSISYYNCFMVNYSDTQLLEANRIRLGFNDPAWDVGVRAHAIDEDFAGEERRSNALIHSSGLFNSRTGLNALNQFNQAEGGITLSLDPSDGSIQKLFAEDTQITIFQEDKISRSPVDKDFIYSAEGGAIPVTSNTQYLGTIAPYPGEYGISQNPESFAVYGTTKYFTDKNRGVVLALSQNGIQEISKAGMSDFFRDALRHSNKIIGSYDEYQNHYNLTIIGEAYDFYEDTNRATATDNYFTIGYEEDVAGWVSFKSFQQEAGLTLNNTFYTFNGGNIWQHNSDTAMYNSFYGESPVRSYIDYIFNDSPSLVKEFKTLGYEGDEDWECRYIETDIDSTGTIPTENTNYRFPGLEITGEASNTRATGERIDVVNNNGTAEWIVVVEPISNQYEIPNLAAVTATVNGTAITGANKSLNDGKIYFRVQQTGITNNNDVRVTIAGTGSRLAFRAPFITLNMNVSATETRLATGQSVSRQFFDANTTYSETVRISPIEYSHYIDASNISSVVTGITPITGAAVINNVAGSDDVTLTYPVRTPAAISGTFNVPITGTATLKPLLTWTNSTPTLANITTSFTGALSEHVPTGPRVPNELETLSFTLNNLTTDIFTTVPTATFTNATRVGGVLNQAEGTATITTRSTITTVALTSDITGSAVAGAATLVDGGSGDITGDFNAGNETRTITSNMGALSPTSDETWATPTWDAATNTLTVALTAYTDTTTDARTATITIPARYERLTGVSTLSIDVEQASGYGFGNFTNIVGSAGGTTMANFHYPSAITDPVITDVVITDSGGTAQTWTVTLPAGAVAITPNTDAQTISVVVPAGTTAGTYTVTLFADTDITTTITVT